MLLLFLNEGIPTDIANALPAVRVWPAPRLVRERQAAAAVRLRLLAPSGLHPAHVVQPHVGADCARTVKRLQVGVNLSKCIHAAAANCKSAPSIVNFLVFFEIFYCCIHLPLQAIHCPLHFVIFIFCGCCDIPIAQVPTKASE